MILNLTRTLVTLLRPRIRRFTTIICAWWLRISSKNLRGKSQTSLGKFGKWSTPKLVRIRSIRKAPSLLFRNTRIKMNQSRKNLLAKQKITVLIRICKPGFRFREFPGFRDFFAFPFPGFSKKKIPGFVS